MSVGKGISVIRRGKLPRFVEDSTGYEVVLRAEGLHWRELNRLVKREAARGAARIKLEGVCGHRYIGTGVREPVELVVRGVPGNDLGAFMNGPRVVVYGNAQDGVGNTMNGGEIIIHGRAGDILAMGMRGGRILVREGVGYRAAIHMKEYGNCRPVLVIGGGVQDFLGEYMAGGLVVVLRLHGRKGEFERARHVGTGMHGGLILVRGEVGEQQLGREAACVPADEGDLEILGPLVEEYTRHFGGDPDQIMSGVFTRIYPRSHRPFGGLYAY
jgi:glutamate synthase domain-containing protein 3